MRPRHVGTRYPVIEPIRDRWSARSFTDEVPDVKDVCSLFEAARLAPSAHNCQPTRFMVGIKGQGSTHDKLFACLYEHNQVWAHRAPVLALASTTRRRFSQATGEFLDYSHSMHDLGLAVMSLILQGTSLGLSCHPLAAFDAEKAQEDFDIPPLFLPGIIVAIGYVGPPNALPPDLKERETKQRTRRTLEEMVFDGTWGEASTLLAQGSGDHGDESS